MVNDNIITVLVVNKGFNHFKRNSIVKEVTSEMSHMFVE